MILLGHYQEGTTPPPQYGRELFGNSVSFKFCLLIPKIPTQNHKGESKVIYTAKVQTQRTQRGSPNVALQFPAAWSLSAPRLGLCTIPLRQHKHLCIEN